MAKREALRRVSDGYRRTIVVGDVHGCLDELRALLGAVSFGPDDLLVAVGDLVDRGPASWEVARLLCDTANALSVVGNHERRLAGVIRGTSAPAWTQLQTLDRVPEAEWPGWADWLDALPLVIETHHAVVVHARLDPARRLDAQDERHACAVGGDAVEIPLDGDGVPLWFRSVSFEKPACIGHVGYQRVELVPGRLFALDTGAAKGGALTAVVFPEGRVVSVPAGRNYWDEAWDDWVLRSDVWSWRLDWILDVLRNHPEGALKTAVETRVAEALANLAPEDRWQAWQDGLAARFGPVPEAGPEKGAYFPAVRRGIENAEAGALAVALLQGRTRDGRDLLVRVGGKRRRLGDVREVIWELERALGLGR